ncbi:MAG: SGNH/GDSL hydrolase family protein [Rhodobacteraceae bacterium]|nr:SGNH/GDSL hydrolase family protein [Paracoccaceae bacterium]MBR9820113.1 SGNH/GDSL hydrolase family protein [Paracoccaceae bacterium]
MTRTILAFGDSLTWGTNPVEGGRHRYEDRWPTVLEQGLGAGHRVIPEGLGGRTTATDDLTAAFDRNGARALPMMLASHSPLDLIVIMLGANDLKAQFCPTIHGAVAGMGRLVEIVESFPYAWGMTAPKILIVSPPHFVAKANGEGPQSGRRIEEGRKLAGAYAELAGARGCGFFDVAPHARASSVDGVHLDAANTRALGAALVAPVREMLG